MLVVDPLVDLFPPEASVSDGSLGLFHVLLDFDAMLFIELIHDINLLLSLVESEEFASLLGLLP